jgi:hypothetical protein
MEIHSNMSQFKQSSMSVVALGLILCSSLFAMSSSAQTKPDSILLKSASMSNNSLVAQASEPQVGNQGDAQPETSVSDAEQEKFIKEDFEEETSTSEEPSSPGADRTTSAKTKGEQALNRALTKAGYHETSNNCNFFSKYFGKGCQPWCADFVSWAFDGDGNKQVPWGYPSTVSSIFNWGKSKNHLVKTPRPGDIFILKDNNRLSHTGIVRYVKGSKYGTIEGNFSNKVVRGKRSIAKATAFVRVP